MIGIVDYGLGNIQAFANIYRRLNIPVTVTATPEALRAASKIILPGVGAFDWAMTRLNESGMRPALEERVVGARVPVLGICVGMQMMADRSDEGQLPGLGWVPGEVRKFDQARFKQLTHLPHMGWNEVRPHRTDSLFRGLDTGARFYFLHSYYFDPQAWSEGTE